MGGKQYFSTMIVSEHSILQRTVLLQKKLHVSVFIIGSYYIIKQRFKIYYLLKPFSNFMQCLLAQCLMSLGLDKALLIMN